MSGLGSWVMWTPLHEAHAATKDPCSRAPHLNLTVAPKHLQGAHTVFPVLLLWLLLLCILSRVVGHRPTLHHNSCCGLGQLSSKGGGVWGMQDLLERGRRWGHTSRPAQSLVPSPERSLPWSLHMEPQPCKWLSCTIPGASTPHNLFPVVLLPPVGFPSPEAAASTSTSPSAFFAGCADTRGLSLKEQKGLRQDQVPTHSHLHTTLHTNTPAQVPTCNTPICTSLHIPACTQARECRGSH